MGKVNVRLSVHDLAGKVTGNIQLDKDLFDGKINKALLYEAKKMYEANSRRGTSSTKTRGEVRGGGAKPWKQKGTGRARVGSTRNPIWRHGGVAFGPKPRDYGYKVPKKALRKALLSCVNARLAEDMVKAVDKIEIKEPKTKEFVALLNNLNVSGSTLLVVDSLSENLKRATNNLKQISLRESTTVNAIDVLRNKNLLIEKEAFLKLCERLG